MSIHKKGPAGKQGPIEINERIKYTIFSRILREIQGFFALKKQLNKVQYIGYEHNGLQSISDNELMARIERSKDSRKRSLDSLAGVPEEIFIEAYKLYLIEAERRSLR